MNALSRIADVCVSVFGVALAAATAAMVIDRVIGNLNARRDPEISPPPAPGCSARQPWWLPISGITPERARMYARN